MNISLACARNVVKVVDIVVVVLRRVDCSSDDYEHRVVVSANNKAESCLSASIHARALAHVRNILISHHQCRHEACRG
jgi:hypothetical protein